MSMHCLKSPLQKGGTNEWWQFFGGVGYQLSSHEEPIELYKAFLSLYHYDTQVVNIELL